MPTPPGAHEHREEGPGKGFSLDVVANFTGAGWSVLVQFACLPLFIKFLGVEGFGLYGFYLVLQGIAQVFDFGLTPTINREMARYSAAPGDEPGALDLARTMELLYWLGGLVLALMIAAGAGSVATHWIKASAISGHEMREAILLMSALMFFQWPLTFYQGGFLGLRRQVLFNALNIPMVALSFGGAAVVLWLVSRTVTAFFAWLIFANAVRTMLLAWCFWRTIGPAGKRARVRWGNLRSIRRFAGGVTVVAIFVTLFSQMDKVVVTWLLPLREFGYYSVAATLAGGLTVLVVAIFNASYPRLSALVALGDHDKVLDLYLRTTQAMAVIVFPCAAVIAFFPREIIHVWTRNAPVASHAAPLAAILVAGIAVSAMSYPPWGVQLAYGTIRISLLVSVILALVTVPALLGLVLRFGAVGAASATVVLYLLDSALQVVMTHRQLLTVPWRPWLREVFVPMGAVVLVAATGRLVANRVTGPVDVAAVIVITAAAALLATACTSAPGRHGARTLLLAWAGSSGRARN